MGAIDEVMSRFNYEWLSRALVIFFAFIPLFAVRELRRVLGEGAISIFFRRSAAAEASRDAPLKTYLRSRLASWIVLYPTYKSKSVDGPGSL